MSKESVPEQPNTFETVTSYEKARTIAQNFCYHEALQTLRKENLLEEQVQNTKELYGSTLEDAHFMTEEDWERITIIHLYSSELAVHCIETYHLVSSKVEKISFDGLTIQEHIKKESISLDEFYRACILHDIGKTAIPKSVLNYTFAPGDWFALLRVASKDSLKNWVHHHFGKRTETEDTETFSIFETIKNYQNSPERHVPVKELLPEEALNKLIERGISTDLTLRQILELHEEASEKILIEENLPTEAAIAGQHHNYAKKEYRFPISSQTLGVIADLADLLRLADVEQALLSERPYKKAFSKLSTYEILIQDAESGATSKELTALWLEDALQQGTIKEEIEEDTEKFQTIMLFIEKYLP